MCCESIRIPFWAACFPLTSTLNCNYSALLPASWQSHTKYASLARKTLCRYGPPGALHDCVNDGQTESCPSAAARPRLIASIKPLEDVRKSVGKYAAAGVPDRKAAALIA